MISTAILHQSMATFPVGLIEFSIGLGYGWTAPMMKLMHDSTSEELLSLTTEQISWVASLHELARALSPVVTAAYADVVGRKIFFIIGAAAYLLVWLMVLFTESVWMLYVVRTIFGLTSGFNDTVEPLYIVENCSPELRGIFGSICLSFFMAGELFAFILVTYLSYNTVALVHAVLQAVIFFSVFLLKEPAQVLIMKGRLEEADQVFHWLKGYKNDATVEEFAGVVKNVLEQKSHQSIRNLLSTKANCKSIAMLFIISIASRATGYCALISFASMTFVSSEMFTANEFTILFGVLQMVGVILSSFFIEKIDRRAVFMAAFSVSAVVHACSAGLYYVQENVINVPYFPWLIFITITVYCVTFSMGILPVYFIIQGEMFPQSIKAIGSSISISVNSAMCFASTKMFLTISDRFGVHTNFILYSLVCLMTLVYVYFQMPETRGKSLIEIQNSLCK